MSIFAHRPRCVVFDGADGIGKCLDGNTAIPTINGIQLIKDIKIGETVYCLDGNLKLKETTVVAIDQLAQKSFAIKLRDGRNIIATDNHPFLTIEGWKQLKDINIGEHIAVPRKLCIKVKDDIIRGCEAELIGLFLGDGTFSKCTLYIHQDDTFVIENIILLVNEFDNKLMVNTKQHKQEKALEVTIVVKPEYKSVLKVGRSYKNPLRELFKLHGLYNLTGANKHVPDCIIDGSDKIIIACLRGLFATDGSINISNKPVGNRIGSVNISFSNKSERMVYQIQHMLLRLGILSKVRRRTTKNSKTPDKRFVNWTLEVITTQSKIDFLNIVGDYNINISNSIKNVLLDSSNGLRASANFDLVPNNIKYTIEKHRGNKSLMEVYGHKDKKAIRNCGFSRDTVALCGTALNNEYLMNLGNSDILWDDVVSIEAIGMRDTYDLQTMPIGKQEPNFVANNIFVHNSTIAKLISQRFNYKYLPQPSPTNRVKYVRDIVKHTDAPPLIKQSLHLLSHIVDAHTEIDGSDLIFDRGIMSTIVYSKLLGLSVEDVDRLVSINSDVYRHFLEGAGYKVTFVIFDRENPYKNNKDDQYERLIPYEDLRKEYCNLYQHMNSNNHRHLYHYKEQVLMVYVDGSIEEVFSKVAAALELS